MIDPQPFIYVSTIPVSSTELFEWHKRPGAFKRLLPPWLDMRMIKKKGQGIQDDVEVTIELKKGPFKIYQVVKHQDYIEGKQFKDVQIKGHFSKWEHTHRVRSISEQSAEMEDHLEYRLPKWSFWMQDWIAPYIEKELKRLFNYRHAILKHDLAIHQGAKLMKILVSGSSGLVGSALIPFLATGGHQVVKLVRAKSKLRPNEISWDISNGKLNSEQLEGFDAVIHLAGENISDERWTDDKKRKILDSRVIGTRLLCQTLAQLKSPPKVLICASAVGYYGNRGDEILTEQSSKGEGFLADVCQKWEEATQKAVEKGIRVVNLRLGMVLSPKGGALKKMLTAFNWCLGGKIGSGKQYMSWVAIDDLLGIIAYAIQQESLKGPVNAVSPRPVTNEELTKVLGYVLNRPTFMTMPEKLAQWTFGELADDLLLTSERVIPQVLESAGFQFAYPDLEKALRHLLGKTVMDKVQF